MGKSETDTVAALRHPLYNRAVMPNEPLIDRIIRKIRDEMARQHLSQQDVANLWGVSQSRIAKLLNKRIEMGIGDLEALCFALSLSLTEIVRQEGFEYVADLTPTELQLLDAYRRRPQPDKEAFLHLLRIQMPKTGHGKPPVLRSRAKS